MDLKFDTERQDKYGRDLAGVFVGDTLINAEMARAGSGVPMAVGENMRFYPPVNDAWEEARAAKAGLFSPEKDCTISAQAVAAESAVAAAPVAAASSSVGDLETYVESLSQVTSMLKDYANVLFAVDPSIEVRALGETEINEYKSSSNVLRARLERQTSMAKSDPEYAKEKVKAEEAAAIAQISRWKNRASDSIDTAMARSEARRLATEITTRWEALTDNNHQLDTPTQAASPALRQITGIGPVTAATVLTVWSHPGRIRTEAAFAALAGTRPIPASSGNTVRYRLNRGGDRHLNHAPHTAIIVRLKCDDQTHLFVEKSTAEGKTKREIIRCLKRYLARRIYRTLANEQLHTEKQAA